MPTWLGQILASNLNEYGHLEVSKRSQANGIAAMSSYLAVTDTRMSSLSNILLAAISWLVSTNMVSLQNSRCPRGAQIHLTDTAFSEENLASVDGFGIIALPRHSVVVRLSI